MAEEKVKITFEIDGIEKSVSSVDELQAALKDVDKQAKKTETALDKTAEAAKDVGKEAAEAGDVGGAGLKVIDEATGGLGTRLVETGKATKVLGKSFVASFKAGVLGASAMGKALIATGIGAIIVGVGLLVAYWDDIVGAVTGVSADQKELLEDTQATAAAQQDALDAISAQENSLKLAGATEKEIRQLKIDQTEEVIRTMEAQLLLQKEQRDAQIEASERNNKIAQGVIAFLTLPITLLLSTVDALTKALSYIPGIDIATNLADDFTGGIADMIFDPEEVKAQGDETIKETEKQLAALKNKRDGFILAGQAEDTKNREEAAAKKKEEEDAAFEEEKRKAEELAALKKAIRDAEANTEAEIRAKSLEDLDLYYEELILKATEQGILTDELEASRLEQMNALKQKYADEDKKRDDDAKKSAKDKADYEKSLQKATENAKLDVASSAFDAISSIAGEQSAAGKAAAVASSTINTYQAATNALANTPAPPPFPQIAAGIAIVSGLMNVKKILSTKVPGKSGGGSSGGGNISIPPPPTFDPSRALEAAQGDTGVENEVTLGNQTGSASASIVKAYVVSDDMTSQQEKDKKINDLARL